MGRLEQEAVGVEVEAEEAEEARKEGAEAEGTDHTSFARQWFQICMLPVQVYRQRGFCSFARYKPAAKIRNEFQKQGEERRGEEMS